MRKHEWRKKEKQCCLPKAKPKLLAIPSSQFVSLSGAGNSNSEAFADCIGVLYSIAYAIKMNSQQLRRLSENHREVYRSDFRKVAPEKLKITLRFKVAKT
ncbi:MAG: hypothetical protein AAFY48_22575 [Bacteroidota bacterium]